MATAKVVSVEPAHVVANAKTAYERNAQHGQNRAGVDLDDEAFDDWESARPIDLHCADERLEDEGDEIRARVHARGHDVLDER